MDLLNESVTSKGGGASQQPKSAAKPGALDMLSPTYSDASDILRDTSPTVETDQQQMMVPPPSTVQRRLGGPAAHLTAAQALAPMTAAKARTFRQDTPSSISSPEDLTPSMRHLLGKYATTSSSEGIGGGRMSSFNFLSPEGSRPNSRRGTLLTLPSLSPLSLSPAPLSPAFAAAAEHQRAQIEEATAAAVKEEDSRKAEETAVDFSAAHGGLGSPIPLSSPLSINLNDSPSEIKQLEAADAFLASTAQKLANNPSLLDSYREKYPHIAASTERYVMSATPAMPPSTDYTDGHNSTGNGTASKGGYYDEESTMELKAQVIYNRALSGHQQVQYTGYQSTAMPSATTAVVASAPPGSADFGDAATSASAQAQASAQALANQKSRESLEEAIAAALARPSAATVTTKTSTNSGNTAATATANTTTTAKTSSTAKPTPHVTPAATAGPMSGAPSAGGGARTVPSARGGSLPASLTPSLPTSVANWTPIDDSEYSLLPGFVRGQMPLEVLNEAATTMHTSVVRRCAAGGGASFTMDDIEEAGALPVGKGKAFINALAKLGRVQLKVVYGQGTVYFFVE